MSEKPIDPSIEAEAQKFAEQQEKTKTYERPEDDPAYSKFQDEITKTTNLDTEAARQGQSGAIAQREANSDYGNYWTRQNIRVSMQKWNEFARQYPEKALAYKGKNSWLEKALGQQQEPQSSPQTSSVAEEAPMNSSDETPDPQSESEDGDVDLIPDKYKGMPSEMAEQMWTDTQYGDEQTNQQLAEYRNKAIEALKAQEHAREQAKTKEIETKYSNLSPDQQQDFASTQHEAVGIINQAIRGQREIADLLSPEEQWVINKVKETYDQQKEQNPDAEPTLQFLKGIDQNVYTNLVNKLTFRLLEEKRQLGDQTRANEIRSSIGIPEQPLDTSELRLTKGEESDPEKAKAQFIKETFEGIAGSINESSLAKVQEYDDRIRAVKEGKPLKPDDTLDDLMVSFKQFTRRDWSEDFDFEGYKNNFRQQSEQKTKTAEPTTEESKSQPLSEEEIKEIKSEAAYKAKVAQAQSYDEGEGINQDLLANEIDWEIGEQFDAHGLAKNSVATQFEQLINLLNNGVDKSRDFHTAPLSKSPDKAGLHLGTAGGAYKDGSFIVLGAPGKQISESGIKSVLVNDAYYDTVDRLSRAYPNINFIRADQANEALKQIVKG